MSRVYNFSAGPSVLPEEVLREAADDGRLPVGAVDRRINQDAQLVDQAVGEEAPVDDAAAFKKQRFDIKKFLNALKRMRQSSSSFALKNVGNTHGTKFLQILIAEII